MGARAYRYLALYEPDPGCLVEVGSERGEGSTEWLDRYARAHGLRFYTADIDPETYAKARDITPGARLCPGRVLLKRVKSVSIAYLDGFDWMPSKEASQTWALKQRARYRRLGVEQTNEASEREHLCEAELVAAKATKRCAVICDDTFWEGRWQGKGAQAVPYLLNEGFEVVDDQHAEPESLGCVVMRRG